MDTGLTFQQHKSLGAMLQAELVKTRSLKLITSWSYGKSKKTSELADKLFRTLDKLICELDNIVRDEAPRGYANISHSEYQQEVDPDSCYSGGNYGELASELQNVKNQFVAGFRPEFRGEDLPEEYQRKRRRSGFTQSEHLHLEQTLHHQLQLAKDTAILIKEKYKIMPKPCGLDIGKLADKWTESILCLMNHLNYQPPD